MTLKKLEQIEFLSFVDTVKSVINTQIRHHFRHQYCRLKYKMLGLLKFC